MIQYLAKTFPSDDSAYRDLWREYVPRTLRVLKESDRHETKEWAKLCIKVRLCLFADRRSKEAILCFQEVVRWTKKHSSERNPSRLISEHALALAYLEDGRTQDAFEILQLMVAVRKTLSEDDPQRCALISLLTNAYEKMGERTKDLKIQKQCFRTRYLIKKLAKDRYQTMSLC
jgi:tetratricopeptide (TPR) repeat protein